MDKSLTMYSKDLDPTPTLQQHRGKQLYQHHGFYIAFLQFIIVLGNFTVCCNCDHIK